MELETIPAFSCHQVCMAGSSCQDLSRPISWHPGKETTMSIHSVCGQVECRCVDCLYCDGVEMSERIVNLFAGRESLTALEVLGADAPWTERWGVLTRMLPRSTMVCLVIGFAERVAPLYGAAMPGDSRVQDCVSVLRRYLDGEATRGDVDGTIMAARQGASDAQTLQDCVSVLRRYLAGAATLLSCCATISRHMAGDATEAEVGLPEHGPLYAAYRAASCVVAAARTVTAPNVYWAQWYARDVVWETVDIPEKDYQDYQEQATMALTTPETLE